MFLKLDTSQDGFLQVEELQKGMGNVFGMLHAESTEWQEMVHELDTNGDGKIDYQEFITAAVGRSKLLNQQNLQIAFNMFDKDGNGMIDKEELRAVFHGIEGEQSGTERDLLEQIMSEVDRNNDNQISFQEYSQAMKQVIQYRFTVFEKRRKQ